MITLALIILTVGLSIYAWKQDNLLYKLTLNPYNVLKKKQYYRFLTSGFVHVDTMHLILNMISFFSFGLAVEQYFSIYFGAEASYAFLLFYISAIIVSDIPSFIKNKNNLNYNSLGASGAISAVIFASILHNPLGQIYVLFFPLPGFIVGVLYIIYTAYQTNNRYSNINHDAHLYGGLYGIAVCLILNPDLIRTFTSAVIGYRPF